MKLPKPRLRQRRPKPKKGYDSFFEQELHENQLKGCEHHPDRVKYLIESTYEPDFIRGNVLIECKGRFRTSSEAAKYVWVRKALPSNKELVFVFYNPNTPMPGAKRRRDGTKLSHKDWAEKNSFTWYSPDTIPKEWSK